MVTQHIETALRAALEAKQARAGLRLVLLLGLPWLPCRTSMVSRVLSESHRPAVYACSYDVARLLPPSMPAAQTAASALFSPALQTVCYPSRPASHRPRCGPRSSCLTGCWVLRRRSSGSG